MASPDRPLPIHTLLNRTAHALQNYLRPHLEPQGLSPGQPKLLRSLYMRGACSQRRLADDNEIDPAAVSRMVDALVRAGLVVRQPSPGDRRSGLVALTPEGRARFLAWEERCMALEEQMLSGFSPQERAQLADYLARAYRNMGGRLLEEGYHG